MYVIRHKGIFKFLLMYSIFNFSCKDIFSLFTSVILLFIIRLDSHEDLKS